MVVSFNLENVFSLPRCHVLTAFYKRKLNSVIGDIQRIETEVIIILVGVDMRTNGLSVSVRTDLLAVTRLLTAILENA